MITKTLSHLWSLLEHSYMKICKVRWGSNMCSCSVTKSCLALCNPMDCTLPGFSVHGISQARIPEWVAISFSRLIFLTQALNPMSSALAGGFFTTKPPGKPNVWWSEVKWLSHVWLFATPWTAAYQAPPSMGFSRQEYWSGLPFPSPGDLPNPGIEPRSPALWADTLPSKPPGKPNVW